MANLTSYLMKDLQIKKEVLVKELQKQRKEQIGEKVISHNNLDDILNGGSLTINITEERTQTEECSVKILGELL